MSFHDTKTLTPGEGGTLARNDPRDLERAEVLLQKGTNRADFLRGQVAKYCWVDLGSNFELSELHAAMGALRARALDVGPRTRCAPTASPRRLLSRSTSSGCHCPRRRRARGSSASSRRAACSQRSTSWLSTCPRWWCHSAPNRVTARWRSERARRGRIVGFVDVDLEVHCSFIPAVLAELAGSKRSVRRSSRV